MRIIFLLCLLFLMACEEESSISTIEIEGSKNLIPEGIAVNESQGKIYLSSIHQKKVVVYDIKSEELS